MAREESREVEGDLARLRQENGSRGSPGLRRRRRGSALFWLDRQHVAPARPRAVHAALHAAKTKERLVETEQGSCRSANRTGPHSEGWIRCDRDSEEEWIVGSSRRNRSDDRSSGSPGCAQGETGCTAQLRGVSALLAKAISLL